MIPSWQFSDQPPTVLLGQVQAIALGYSVQNPSKLLGIDLTLWPLFSASPDSGSYLASKALSPQDYLDHRVSKTTGLGESSSQVGEPGSKE